MRPRYKVSEPRAQDPGVAVAEGRAVRRVVPEPEGAPDPDGRVGKVLLGAGPVRRRMH